MKRREKKTMNKEKVREYLKFFNSNRNNYRELEIAFIFYTIYDEKEITDEMIYKIDRETNNKSILDKDIRDSIEDFDEVNNKEENEEEIELNEK